MSSNLLSAIAYQKLGFSVIPVRPDKKPHVGWGSYQQRHASEDEIRSWWTQWPSANVGIVTGAISGIAVVDLDDTEKAREALAELVPDSLMFPIADTPSGGEHWYFRCPDSSLTNNARTIPGADLRCNGGYVVAPPSIGSNGKPYAWREGLKPGKIEIPMLPDAYVQAVVRASGPAAASEALSLYKKENKNSLSIEDVTLRFSEGRRDEDLFTVANALAKGGMSDTDILQTLAAIASTWGEGHLTDWFNDKVKSAIKRKEHREISVTKEIEALLAVTDGAFSVTECDKTLQAITGVTKCYKNAVRQVLHRLKKEGRVKKYGDKDGWYIRVDDVADEIDWWSAEDAPLNLRFPLDIENYAEVFPKNIAVLAGEPNAGKTAFLLNFARLNMKNHKIVYCSSEMGATELKKRLQLFDNPLSDWKSVRFVERVANFADVIDPDGVNIIDFMELNDNFYLIGQYLRDIYDKLNKGFCFVAIQKDGNKDVGRGGTMGLEKPRLYLNMGQNMLTIHKAKAWKDHSYNPNGLTCKYKLTNGSNFIAVGNWEHK